MRLIIAKAATLAGIFAATAAAAQGAEIIRCEGKGTSGILGIAPKSVDKLSYYQVGPDSIQKFSEETNSFEHIPCGSDWYTCNFSKYKVSYSMSVPNKNGNEMITEYDVSIDLKSGKYKSSISISSGRFNESIAGKCSPSTNPTKERPAQ